PHRPRHSFPTRRSSDLLVASPAKSRETRQRGKCFEESRLARTILTDEKNDASPNAEVEALEEGQSEGELGRVRRDAIGAAKNAIKEWRLQRSHASPGDESLVWRFESRAHTWSSAERVVVNLAGRRAICVTREGRVAHGKKLSAFGRAQN